MRDDAQCCTSKLISNSTATNLLEQFAQGCRAQLSVGTASANAIKVWVPDPHAGELVPTSRITSALDEILDVLCDLVFRAHCSPAPGQPDQHNEDRNSERNGTEHIVLPN